MKSGVRTRTRPRVSKAQWLERALDVLAAEGEAGLRRLRRLAELRIKKEIEPTKGVAAVRVRGGLEEEIHVLVDDEPTVREVTGILLEEAGYRVLLAAGDTTTSGSTTA